MPLRDDKMKKICFVTTIYSTFRSFLKQFSVFLYESGEYDISLICDGNSVDKEDLPSFIHLYPVKMKRGISLSAFSAIRQIKKIFKEQQFDIVQYSTPNAAFYASIAAKKAKIPVRLYCQWGMAYVGFSGIRRFVFKRIEKIICQLSTWIEPDSYGNLEFAHKEKLYPASKSSVVWNGSACGIDLIKFNVNEKEKYRKIIREKYNLSDKSFVFGFVGRITGDKGINELFSAFKTLSEQYNDIYLLLVGAKEKEKSLSKDLLNWAENFNRIIFAGRTSVVEQYLSAMDCFVLPSYREGFGIGTIEAEAMSVPVIVTDIPGPSDAMIGEVTGIKVIKKDISSLQNAMERMINDKNNVFGENGLKFVVDNFEQKRFFEYLLADRERLLNDSAR